MSGRGLLVACICCRSDWTTSAWHHMQGWVRVPVRVAPNAMDMLAWMRCLTAAQRCSCLFARQVAHSMSQVPAY